MAAEHAVGVHVPGVAGLPGDRLGRVAEPVVVVGDRHDPRAAAPANVAVPGAREPLHGPVDEDLDGVGTLRGLGKIPDAEVEAQLLGMKVGNGAGHGDSLGKRTGWGDIPPGPGFT
jgi:hypothetical protein